MNLWAVALIGTGIGFLGGLLGKGGSAIATPLLHAVGVPAIIAVAGPLPATIPSTMVAGWAYSRERLVDWRIVRWSAAVGVPATIVGALLTRWISGGVLVKVTDVVLVAMGGRLLIGKGAAPVSAEPVTGGPAVETPAVMLAAVAAVVGLASGLLANSGGFLLAPLYISVLRLPIKAAFANSLAVASVLAIPGTIVHAALGHIDWTLVAVFGSTSIPLSFIGAKVAIRTDAHRLEKIYGLALVVLGTVFLFIH